MKINLEEIKKVAKLAKFDITDQEAQTYTNQMSTVLGWVDQLQSVDTSAVADGENDICAPLRADEPVLSAVREDIVSAFNDRQDNFLKVRKVL